MIKWLKQLFCKHVFKVMCVGTSNQRYRECLKCGCIKYHPPRAKCADEPINSINHVWIEGGDWWKDTDYWYCLNCGKTKGAR